MGKPEGLWKAVKIAKNEPCDNLPAILTLNNIPVNDIDLPNAFSDYFHNKVNTMRQNLAICPNVYNGKCILSTWSPRRCFVFTSELGDYIAHYALSQGANYIHI